ncbi:hypothetical protein RF11_15824 [Thelohanellus kitauei]|uniref:Uncharacterized protein n=1 Tax=Thelohanellus kitauei TaxID=669202 RepID=A0A0C2MRJ4_THEKT|nr:hypothetical protein RF11_15824 [Thelohanellus kitauei]
MNNSVICCKIYVHLEINMNVFRFHVVDVQRITVMAKFELCYQCFLSRCYNHCTTFNFSESRVESAALVKFNVLCTLLVSAFFYQQGSLLHCDFISLFFFYTSQSILETLFALITTVKFLQCLFKP